MKENMARATIAKEIWSNHNFMPKNLSFNDIKISLRDGNNFPLSFVSYFCYVNYFTLHELKRSRSLKLSRKLIFSGRFSLKLCRIQKSIKVKNNFIAFSCEGMVCKYLCLCVPLEVKKENNIKGFYAQQEEQQKQHSM
jgi:hypothetical protein